MKKFIVVLMLLVMFLSACGTNTQTVIQVVVTATPEKVLPTLYPTLAPVEECNSQVARTYSNGLLPLMSASTADVNSAVNAVQSTGDMTSANSYIQNARDHAQEILTYLRIAVVPPCLSEWNDNLIISYQFALKAENEWLAGDYKSAGADFQASADWLQRALDSLPQDLRNTLNG